MKLSSPNLAGISLPKQGTLTPRNSSTPPRAGRFSSPLGLSSPESAKPPAPSEPIKPIPEKTVEAATNEVVLPSTSVEQPPTPAANDLGGPKPSTPITSKVQLVAEAFRQRSGVKKAPAVFAVRTEPSIAEPPISGAVVGHAKEPTLSAAKERATEQTVSAAKEPLDVLELSAETQTVSEVPPPIPEGELEPMSVVASSVSTFDSAGSSPPKFEDTPAAVDVAKPQASDPALQAIAPIAVVALEGATRERSEPSETATTPLDAPGPGSIAPSAMVSVGEVSERAADPTHPPDTTPSESRAQAPIAAPAEPESSKRQQTVAATGAQVVSRDSTADHSPESHARHSESALSLESSVAAEFFSRPPASSQHEVEHEHFAMQDPVSMRTPQQLARRQYLRRVVLRSMIALLVFVVAVIAYQLWQRGIPRLGL